MKSNDYSKKWRKNNPMYMRLRQCRNRYAVLAHYSNGEPRCYCCGEKTLDFLCIDHIDGGGNKDRKIRGMGTRLVDSLLRDGFPKGFQVLCHNCNMAKSFTGTCPHKIKDPAYDE